MRKWLILFAALLVALLVPRDFDQVVQAQATMPVGASWHGYIMIEFAAIGPFVNGVTDAQKIKIREALEMVAQTHTSWPPFNLQYGPWRLDSLAVIVEAKFAQFPTKAMVVQLISNRSGYTVAQVNSALAFTVFGYGGTWSESRVACAAYLDANRADWDVLE